MFTLTMKETMKGWLELNEGHLKEPFEFTINVTFMHRLQPWRPQPFLGSLTLAQRGVTVETHGYLTLKPAGTRYELRFTLPELGPVHARGEKSFDLLNLKESLVTCPLTLFQEQNAIGYAEVTYQKPIITFPFQALRLTSYVE